jgi:hypothetical protein
VITEIILARQFSPELQENALEHFVDIFLYGILKEGA